MTSIESERGAVLGEGVSAPSRAGVRSVALGCGAVAAAIAFRGLFDLEQPRGPGLQGAEAFMFSPSGGSPMIIFGGTAWLLARRWQRLRDAIGLPPQTLAGATLLAIGVALCLWSYYTSEASLLLPALSSTMLGAAFWLGGMVAARSILLPAVFLLLAMPAPAVLLNPILYPVQLATVASTTWILNHVGLGPALSSGDRIFHDRAIFQVIEACSGVRTVQTILMAAFLYHDLFFRSRLQSTLLILSAPLIGLVANQIRVLMIVLNPYSEFAAVHTAQGLVMIVAAVLMLAALDSLLNRVLSQPERRRRRRVASQPVALPRAATLAALLIALAVGSLGVKPWEPERAALAPLSSLPPQIDGWQAEGLKLDREFLGTATFTEYVYRRYAKDGAAVDVLIGSDDRLDPRIDFASAKTVVPASGWETERLGAATLASGREVERWEAHLATDYQLLYRWTEGAGSPAVEIARSLLALDRTPLRREGRVVLVRLGTPIGADGQQGAEARLRDFAALLEPLLAERTGAAGR